MTDAQANKMIELLTEIRDALSTQSPAHQERRHVRAPKASRG